MCANCRRGAGRAHEVPTAYSRTAPRRRSRRACAISSFGLLASSPSRVNPLLLSLGFASFVVGLDGRVVAPLLPTIAREFQITIAQAGWLVSAYLLPYGFCQLVYGPLADRFGKVRVAAHALVVFSVGTALCGTFSSFAAIVALRAVTGAAAAALIPLTIAYIGDTVPYARRQAALATLMATLGASQALSTSAGGTIATLLSWRSVFPLLGALSGVATVALFCYRSREQRVELAGHARRPRYRDVLQAPGTVALLALVGAEGFFYVGGLPFLSGLLEGRFQLGAFAIGLILGLSGVSQLLAACLLPLLLARTSERALLRVGGSIMGGSFLLCAFAPGWPLIATASALGGAGFTLCHSTLQVRATEAFPNARGMALALFALSLFSGSALGTASLGYAADAFGYGLMFSVVGLLLLALTMVAVRTLGARPATAGE